MNVKSNHKIAVTLVFFLTFLASCSSPDVTSFKPYISGYWEIERVVLSNGAEKNYNFNENIDFFEIKDSAGIRKKVRPKLDGGFTITKNSESFILKMENDSLRMYYSTPFASWKETVILAKESQIIIKNEDGNMYFYKPYQKLDL